MNKNLLTFFGKAVIAGLGLGIGLLGTIGIAITVNTTFTSGDTLTADSLNILKSAIESIPGWIKGSTVTDAVYVGGNVGIGTSNPGKALDIVGNDLRLRRSTSTNGPVFFLDATNVGTGGSIWQLHAATNTDSGLGGGKFSITDNGVYRLNIDTSGNVGIGTTNPVSKLAVTGLPSGTNDTVAGGALAGAVCITDTGNMYIDTGGSCVNN